MSANAVDDILYKCNFCDEYCNGATELKKHFLVHLNKVVFIKFKPKTFEVRLKRLTLQNISKEHNIRTIRVQDKKSTWITRCLIARVDDNGDYVCRFCSHIFKDIPDIHEHVAFHTIDHPFVCFTCGMEFRCKKYTNVHQRLHHKLKKFSCSFCKKSFKRMTHVKTHEQEVHQYLRPFTCGICHKSFTRGTALSKHVRSHMVNGKFKCDYCPEDFPTLPRFIAHLKTHSDKGTYKCEHCKGRFMEWKHLFNHMRYHNEVLPYSCSQCEIKFRDPFARDKHFRDVHDLQDEEEKTNNTIPLKDEPKALLQQGPPALNSDLP